jgi:RNA polymerase sigma factor (TIGR02999 family)
MSKSQTHVTSLLSAAARGDAEAVERLWRRVYDELHRMAKARMAREGHRGDLQTTVLVQEAYMRLVGRNGESLPSNRRHFFAAAANAMRQFLVDDARRRGAQKRGGGRRPGDLEGAAAALDLDPAELLALDEALTRLRALDETMADIVQLRYFAGLTIDETAEVLEISPRQVDDKWWLAKAKLHKDLS